MSQVRASENIFAFRRAYGYFDKNVSRVVCVCKARRVLYCYVRVCVSALVGNE